MCGEAACELDNGVVSVLHETASCISMHVRTVVKSLPTSHPLFQRLHFNCFKPLSQKPFAQDSRIFRSHKAKVTTINPSHHSSVSCSLLHQHRKHAHCPPDDAPSMGRFPSTARIALPHLDPCRGQVDSPEDDCPWVGILPFISKMYMLVGNESVSHIESQCQCWTAKKAGKVEYFEARGCIG